VFVHRKVIIDLAAEHRIAAVYSLQVYVEPGGLMSYGVNVPEMQQRAAIYVDKILKGAKPAAQQVRADQHIRCRIPSPETCRQYRAPQRIMWSGVSAG
jgi:putative ABC transport system substrate-binding protein